MDAVGPYLDAIEAALGNASSALSRAVFELSSQPYVRGTCLMIGHGNGGEALIADQNWSLTREETLKNRKTLTVTDLAQDGDFHRLSVLVELNTKEWGFSEKRCELAVAAIDVTEAMADIAAAFSRHRSKDAEAPMLNANAI